MKTIGSHPGAILFRLSVMVILIAVVIFVFFSYVAKVRENAERAAIIRTKGLIDSSLAVVFSTYAAQARLDELNDLNGANPFEFLRQYQLLPQTYVGEIDTGPDDRAKSGWYYQRRLHQVIYKPRYLEQNFRYELLLEYDDLDQSGRFEPGPDHFKGLYFVELADTND